MNKISIAFLLGCLGISTVHASEKLPIYKNQLLSKAKIKLIKSGWKPYPTLSLLVIDHPEDVSLISRGYMDAGYVEVGNCGVSTPYCEFNYKKRGKCLKVIAGGYEDDVKENRVEGWTRECEK